ncbi:MAG: hypothetical protein JO149_02675, partial [Gammaproteobacteria bacterium]|nr:hypothetical protein [Gammaproteobacteria bacterium]
MSGLIFELSRKERFAKAQWPVDNHTQETCDDIPAAYLRTDVPCLPEVSEL